MRLVSVAFGWAVGASLVATIAGQAGDPRFDVVSVRPNTGRDLSIPFGPTPPDGITLTNSPLESIIRYAYSVQPFRLVGVPGWTREERFDITAKASAPITDAERRLMMRALLVDRFRLKAHFESRDQTVYVMTRAQANGQIGPGLRLRPDCVEKPCESSGSSNRATGIARVRATTLDRLAEGALSLMLDQVVRNESGVAGTFDVELSWRPDTADPTDNRPSFFTAVEEQLGMRLSPQRRPVDVLVIDSIERPTAN